MEVWVGVVVSVVGRRGMNPLGEVTSGRRTVAKPCLGRRKWVWEGMLVERGVRQRLVVEVWVWVGVVVRVPHGGGVGMAYHEDASRRRPTAAGNVLPVEAWA